MYIPKVHGNKESSHAPFPHLNPLPPAGDEANESLREFYVYDEQEAVGALESALASTLACEPLQVKLEEARKSRKLKALEELLRISEARGQGIIDAEQALQLERDYALRRKVIMVDDFSPEQLQAGK
ncbi:MAG: acyl-CoA dehydrogenase domain-containing protein [Gallionella sp.]